MLFVTMGIAGSFVAGVVLDTTYQHSLYTKLGFSGLLLSYLWFFFEGAAGRNFIMVSFPCSFLVHAPHFPIHHPLSSLLTNV